MYAAQVDWRSIKPRPTRLIKPASGADEDAADEVPWSRFPSPTGRAEVVTRVSGVLFAVEPAPAGDAVFDVFFVPVPLPVSDGGAGTAAAFAGLAVPAAAGFAFGFGGMSCFDAVNVADSKIPSG